MTTYVTVYVAAYVTAYVTVYVTAYVTAYVTSGVIGSTAPMYDIWGDTVNLASRMMSTGLNGKIQVSNTIFRIIHQEYCHVSFNN